MLLNSFYQMAPVIFYTFITEAKQDAVWQKNSAIYPCISLHITILTVFLMCGYTHIYIHYKHIYTHT